MIDHRILVEDALLGSIGPRIGDRMTDTAHDRRTWRAILETG